MDSSSSIKIGNAGGFWGDRLQAPALLVFQQPDLDFLTIDYLSEVSLSIMAIQHKDEESGFAKDFVQVVESLVPLWQGGAHVKVITNAGGLNARGCASACQKVLDNAGLFKKIGLVLGDDVKEHLMQDPQNALFRNLETHASLEEIQDVLVTANAYVGAASIAEALALGADIVITGRVADPSLTVAPCLFHYQWQKDDYHKIAGATIAGHLIECGTQVTGGISTHWLSISDQAHIGYPVVEVFEDGSCIITKPAGTGGEVSLRTVKEQLLYEIGDPANYLSPDATVSFLQLQLQEIGADRVYLSGASGTAPPDTYKVSATYRCGFKSEATLAIAGPDAVIKGKMCGQIVRQRVLEAGYDLAHFHVECIGGGALAGMPASYAPPECLLRLSAADPRYAALECFTKEIAPLVTSGPQGTTGYINGRPKIRQMFGYWPCLIHKDLQVSTCLYSAYNLGG